MKTTTGLTITEIKMNGATRIEVESDKLKTVKNSKYRHSLDDAIFSLMNRIFKHNKVV